MNEVLLGPDQWLTAKKLLEGLGINPHPDGPKNWDHYLALSSILQHVDPGELVVDGGGYSGVFCRWLRVFGYRQLQVINPVFKTEQEITDGILLKRGDITRTSLPSGGVGCLTCMSVIEHGVDLERFLGEAYRILKPGGRLIVSTDYWPDKMDTSRLHDDVYKCPVIVFSSTEMRNFLAMAIKEGFRPSSVPTFGAEQRVVTWERMGLKYTFIIFEFIRDSRVKATS